MDLILKWFRHPCHLISTMADGRDKHGVLDEALLLVARKITAMVLPPFQLRRTPEVSLGYLRMVYGRGSGLQLCDGLHTGSAAI